VIKIIWDQGFKKRSYRKTIKNDDDLKRKFWKRFASGADDMFRVFWYSGYIPIGHGDCYQLP